MASETSMSAEQYLALDDDSLVRQCEVDCYRASGPGGQKRNKTSSAVRLRHGPTGLMAIAEEDRSQHSNKRRAIRRLREAIVLSVRTSIELEAYRRSDLMEECVASNGRLRVSQRNPRYYSVASEVLDVLHACGMRVRDAAKSLGLTTAALVDFLERDRKLWERVNQMRSGLGMKRLR